MPRDHASARPSQDPSAERLVATAPALLAWAELMRRYNRKLYRTARAVTGDNGEAEDIVQEALDARLRAHPGFPQ